MSKLGKIRWIVENFFKDPERVMQELKQYWLHREEDQKILDAISENTITTFPMPYSVAPNFIINGRTYCVPMVTEESSVVAAASSAAKFWMTRGGFHTELIDVEKVGHVHFVWRGEEAKLRQHFDELKALLLEQTAELTANMRKRGGGIRDIDLRTVVEVPIAHYYQLVVTFDTCDSMGANFINTVLEAFARILRQYFLTAPHFSDAERDVEILMAILSNYTPQSRVHAEVRCAIEELGEIEGYSAEEFARRFKMAIDIARHDIYRAVTHNKGIFNGVDAVVIATGNDFRAVEACGHSYAVQDGLYRGLSQCSLDDGTFRFWLELPMAVGTVGGLTRLHPIARRSLELLGFPSAKELMQIIAAVGLAQNFAAVRSLITTGIQKGHMKMHLNNILLELGATEEQSRAAVEYFKDKTVSYRAVADFIRQFKNSC